MLHFINDNVLKDNAISLIWLNHHLLYNISFILQFIYVYTIAEKRSYIYAFLLKNLKH